MVETGETVTVQREQLNEIEQRALSMNSKLLGLMKALRAGEVDQALSIAGLLQELNAKQRRAAIAAGAVDSAAASVGGYSTVWDEDEPPVDAETLDLAALRTEFGPE